MMKLRHAARGCVAALALLGCADAAPSLPVTGCTASAQCDDGVACTTDLCVVGGACQHVTDASGCASGMTCDAVRGCVAPGSTACARAADCDDGVACTRDACLVDRSCSHVAQDDQCPTGQRCDLRRGCSAGSSAGCATAADCDDRFACTDDVCGVDGACTHVAQNARCASGMRCIAGMGCVAERVCGTNADCDDHLACDGAETCSELACVAGAAVGCDDGDACTVDACVEGATATCSHAPNPTCAGTTVRSGFYDLAMPVAYTCSGLGMTVVDYMFAALQFTVTGATMTVSGAPVPMTGGTPDASGRFRVSGTMSGDCNETYTLDGTFATATRFTGAFSQSFAGLSCGLTDCAARAWSATGTAR